MALELVSSAKCYNGFQKVFKHLSSELHCSMNFSVYEPFAATSEGGGERLPVLFYLSGLTCSEQNFIQKSGFQKYASEHKLIVVGPDTSPRGCDIPGDKEMWDFGEGAGAYVDAVKEPWSKHYRMYSYVTIELPKIINDNFSTSGKFGICGHSMGGHGAIVCGLRRPDLFQSISAFAPIVNPIITIWARDKVFKNYLGDENEDKLWPLYDSCEIMKSYTGPARDILVDQGDSDEFLQQILHPENLIAAAAQSPHHVKLTLRMQPGYNHSYFFVQSFIPDHIAHHAKILNA